jgi:hypothetical protein
MELVNRVRSHFCRSDTRMHVYLNVRCATTRRTHTCMRNLETKYEFDISIMHTAGFMDTITGR